MQTKEAIIFLLCRPCTIANLCYNFTIKKEVDKMNTCIDVNGVIICNECSIKNWIEGQTIRETEGLFCEECFKPINKENKQ
jgi:hypothetical protein